MSVSQNLQLNLTPENDTTTTFKNWRIGINGEDENSNMNKIDTAFGQLQEYAEQTQSDLEKTDSELKSKADKADVYTKDEVDFQLANKADTGVLSSAVDYVNENLSAKVDKAEGKGLSTNDFTDEDKEKLHVHENQEVLDKLKRISPSEADFDCVDCSITYIDFNSKDTWKKYLNLAFSTNDFRDSGGNYPKPSDEFGASYCVLMIVGETQPQMMVSEPPPIMIASDSDEEEVYWRCEAQQTFLCPDGTLYERTVIKKIAIDTQEYQCDYLKFKKITDDSKSDKFIITVTMTDNVYQANRSYEEIKSAFEKNTNVLAFYNNACFSHCAKEASGSFRMINVTNIGANVLTFNSEGRVGYFFTKHLTPSDTYTKAEVDSKIGDIDTALDGIIALENQLIGEVEA